MSGNFDQEEPAECPRLPRWRRRIRVLRRIRWDWTIPTALGAATGGLLSLTNIPVPWLMGPLASSLILAAVSRRAWSMPDEPRAFAQVLLGLAVGLNLDLHAMAGAGGTVVAMLLMVLLTFALSMLNGYLLSRWTGIDRGAAFLGSVPGAASALVAMSADVGVDPRLVAVIQYLRVLGVAILVPFVVEHGFPLLPADWLGQAGAPLSAPSLASSTDFHPTATEADALATGADGLATGADALANSNPDAILWSLTAGDIGLLILLGIIGVTIGKRLRLPSYVFLGPCLTAIAATHLLNLPLAVPPEGLNVALVLLGTWIGLLFDLPLVRKLGRVTVLNFVLLVLMVVASVGLAWGFAKLTGVSILTAFLANAPGAMEVIVATAINLNADPPLVAAVQMIRFMAMMLLGPLVAARLAGDADKAEDEKKGEAVPSG